MQPYSGWSDDDVIRAVTAGFVLPMPSVSNSSRSCRVTFYANHDVELPVKFIRDFFLLMRYLNLRLLTYLLTYKLLVVLPYKATYAPYILSFCPPVQLSVHLFRACAVY